MNIFLLFVPCPLIVRVLSLPVPLHGLFVGYSVGFIGNNKHVSDNRRLTGWSNRVVGWRRAAQRLCTMHYS
jgi:hypothetical protein